MDEQKQYVSPGFIKKITVEKQQTLTIICFTKQTSCAMWALNITFKTKNLVPCEV